MGSQSGASVKSVILNVFLGVCIIAALGFGVLKTNQLSSAQAELANTNSLLTKVQTNLTSTKAILADTETELSQTQDDLTAARDELDNAKADLSNTQDELTSTKAKLTDTTSQLTQAKADYTTILNELNAQQESYDALQSNLANLQANYNSLTTGYGYVLKDPTYQEVKAFIAADTTDSNLYIDDTYVCEDFSFDVKVHAMQHKFRCAYVSIRFYGSNGGHAIVAFNTTDRGIIYIEPQSDEEVNLQAGRHYWTQCVIPTPGHYYLAPTTYDDTIERFNVIW